MGLPDEYKLPERYNQVPLGGGTAWAWPHDRPEVVVACARTVELGPEGERLRDTRILTLAPLVDWSIR